MEERILDRCGETLHTPNVTSRIMGIALLMLTGSVRAGYEEPVIPVPHSETECADDRGSPLWSIAECRRAVEVHGMFERLLKASRRLPEYRSDWREPKLIALPERDEWNAEYDWDFSLALNRGALRTVKNDRLMWVILSHELGHWVQHMRRMKVLPETHTDPRKGRYQVFFYWWNGRRYPHPRVETQADLRGLRLSLLAGVSKEAWLQGFSHTWNCDHAGDDQEIQGDPHVGPRLRLSNMIGVIQALTQANAPSMDVDDSMDRVKDDGAVVNQKLLAPARARELCRALQKS